jgi:hypothetical protein
MGKDNVVQTPSSCRILLAKSVVDPDSLNPDTDSDPAFKVNSDPCGDFILRLMLAHLVILWRVIPSPPPMDMKQYRYLNFDKSHPLILNYHEKVLGYVPQ